MKNRKHLYRSGWTAYHFGTLYTQHKYFFAFHTFYTFTFSVYVASVTFLLAISQQCQHV